MLFAEVQNRIYASPDIGVTWSSIDYNDSDPQKPVPAMKLSDPKVICAALGKQILYSVDKGTNWIAFRPAIQQGPLFGLWLDPSDSQSLYAQTFSRLHHSTDGGKTWQQLPLSGVDHAPITSLFFDAYTPGSIYMFTGPIYVESSAGDVYRSPDGGQNWIRMVIDPSGNVPVDFFTLIPDAAGTLFVGGANYLAPDTNLLFRSDDHGTSWTKTGLGLPTSGQVAELVSTPSNPSIVYAAVYGRGTFKSTDGGKTWLPAGSR